MNVSECAEQLRSSGFEVYTWRPHEGTVEPDLVAKRYGQLFNVYLSFDETKKKEIVSFAKAHNTHVLYVV
ncbi:MAG: hypothetical protein KBS43_01825 [Oscillospiraceae bacterium]|nr:hypothetical protein [Candidatus Limimonas coprohippi]MCQ2488071.1 hypothetical protein [Clostridia bacterium]